MNIRTKPHFLIVPQTKPQSAKEMKEGKPAKKGRKEIVSCFVALYSVITFCGACVANRKMYC